MQRTVRLFVVEGDGAKGTPKPGQPFSVEADSVDGLREAVRAAILERGFVPRSISYGDKGMVAYAEPRL